VQALFLALPHRLTLLQGVLLLGEEAVQLVVVTAAALAGRSR
jgi:hypothetical protein